MAVVPWTVVTSFDGGKLIKWSGLSGGDIGAPFVVAEFGRVSIELSGMFGGPVWIEGTLAPDGDDFGALTDRQGMPLSGLTSARRQRLGDAPYRLRPRAGQGVKHVDVWLLLARG